MITWVFLFRDRYLILNSFFKISALVALVPIPLPLICERRSSSSISWPAFSIARIIEPELYRFGGDVSPSLIPRPFMFSISPFFSFCNAANKASSQETSPSPSLSGVFPEASAILFFAKEFAAIFRYPSLSKTLKEEKKDSFSIFVTRLTF